MNTLLGGKNFQSMTFSVSVSCCLLLIHHNQKMDCAVVICPRNGARLIHNSFWNCKLCCQFCYWMNFKLHFPLRKRYVLKVFWLEVYLLPKCKLQLLHHLNFLEPSLKRSLWLILWKEIQTYKLETSEADMSEFM